MDGYIQVGEYAWTLQNDVMDKTSDDYWYYHAPYNFALMYLGSNKYGIMREGYSTTGQPPYDEINIPVHSINQFYFYGTTTAAMAYYGTGVVNGNVKFISGATGALYTPLTSSVYITSDCNIDITVDNAIIEHSTVIGQGYVINSKITDSDIHTSYIQIENSILASTTVPEGDLFSLLDSDVRIYGYNYRELYFIDVLGTITCYRTDKVIYLTHIDQDCAIVDSAYGLKYEPKSACEEKYWMSSFGNLIVPSTNTPFSLERNNLFYKPTCGYQGSSPRMVITSGNYFMDGSPFHNVTTRPQPNPDLRYYYSGLFQPKLQADPSHRHTYTGWVK